jgi:predicted GIY-YIG superfamily endonuclease
MRNKMQVCTIYCLKLEHGCYYVGKTTNLGERIFQHRNGMGSTWTRLHPMIDVYRIWMNIHTDVLDEDKHTKEMMLEFGISKVRGGSYIQEHLSEAQITALERELIGATDKCFKCGMKGHFARYCNTASTASQVPQSQPSSPTSPVSTTRGIVDAGFTLWNIFRGNPIPETREPSYNTEPRGRYVCYRCGVAGHLYQNCPLGRTITSTHSVRCGKCGRNGHTTMVCKVVNPVDELPW